MTIEFVRRARMSMIAGRPTVIVRAHNMREHWVGGMLKHEIGQTRLFKHCCCSFYVHVSLAHLQ